MHTAHAFFNDEEFPCRSLSRPWDDQPSYDSSAFNPLDPWLGDRTRVQMPSLVPQRNGELGMDQAAQEQAVNPGPPPTSEVLQRCVNQEHQDMAADGGASLRRSARGWHPSTVALENIASDVNHVAYLEEILDLSSPAHLDMVQSVRESGWLHNEMERDLLYATQCQSIPRTYGQVKALPPPERDQWLEACREHCRSFLAIPAISGKLHRSQWTKAPPVHLAWVFTTKPPSAEPKARIVMLGQHMKEGVHFNDTHAPVASVTSVRVLLAITAATKRLLTQLDVKAAFLTAPLDIELDVILPEGFGVRENDSGCSTPEDRRRRALTAIPGCPQGSRVWRQRLLGVLASLGFKPFLPDDPCLFKDSAPDPIFLFTWVDVFCCLYPSDTQWEDAGA